MSEPRSLFIDVEGRRRHVALWGDDANPALLLVHGLRDHARSWDWIARRFCGRFLVVAPDLRGHGDSDWFETGAYALSDYVMDLADVVDSLGLKDINLIGHSLGGHIVLRYAAAYPEKIRALCIIEGIELPIVRDQRREPVRFPVRLRYWIDHERDGRGRAPLFYPTQADAQERMAARNPKIDAETIAHLTRHGIIHVSGKGYRWKFDNACRFRAPDDPHGVDLDEILDSIACPTMLAYGDESWIPVPPTSRLNRLKSHRVTTFANASHWLHHQSREPFAASLETFLSHPSDFISDKREHHA